MAKLETFWEKRRPFSLNAAALWTFADGTDSGANLYDASGKDRNFTTSSAWALQQSVLNGYPALYNDGTKAPFVYAGNIKLKHFFIVAAFDGAIFDGNRGLLAGLTTNTLLAGSNGTDKFADNGLPVYRQAEVTYAANNQKALMSGGFAIYEIVIPAGVSISSLQIGGAPSASNWKGWFVELVGFALRKGFLSRMQIYKYLAEKYYLYRETSDGKKIFPFPNNHASPFSPLAYRVQSPALPNGKTKFRVKGSLLEQFDYNFGTRQQTELDALRDFERRFFDGRAIAVENNSFYPPRRHNIIPTSVVSKDPNSINLHGYKWSGRQSDTSETPLIVDFDELDVTAPTAPVLSSAVSGNKVNYTWTASVDDVEADRYELEVTIS